MLPEVRKFWKMDRVRPQYKYEEHEPGVFLVDGVSRHVRGKTQCKRLRKEGLVPGIIFGGSEAPQLICVRSGLLESLLWGRGLFGFDYMISIDGSEERVRVTPHMCELHPTSDVPLSITLFRVPPPEPEPPVLTFEERYPTAYAYMRAEWKPNFHKRCVRGRGTWRHPVGPMKATIRNKRKNHIDIKIPFKQAQNRLGGTE
jgi:ribosomal protein L25 (general stress protein Ctc)